MVTVNLLQLFKFVFPIFLYFILAVRSGVILGWISSLYKTNPASVNLDFWCLILSVNVHYLVRKRGGFVALFARVPVFTTVVCKLSEPILFDTALFCYVSFMGLICLIFFLIKKKAHVDIVGIGLNYSMFWKNVAESVLDFVTAFAELFSFFVPSWMLVSFRILFPTRPRFWVISYNRT